MNEVILNAMLAAMAQSAKTKQTEQAKQTTKKDTRKDSAKLGKELHKVYLGFIDAGFNDKQAFQLMLALFNKVGGAF